MGYTTQAAYIAYTAATGYFTNRLEKTAWSNAGETSANAALISAADQIDQQYFKGYKKTLDGSQARAFPRYTRDGGRDLPSTGASSILVEASDSLLQMANCEQALWLLETAGRRDQRAILQEQGVKSISLGGVSESYGGVRGPRAMLCAEAKRLLDPFLFKIGSKDEVHDDDLNFDFDLVQTDESEFV